MVSTDSACRSVESVTRAWRFRSRSSPSIAQPPPAYPGAAAATFQRTIGFQSGTTLPLVRITTPRPEDGGGPFLASNPGSILTSAEALCMIAGRLEFYTVVVVLTPAFWRR